MNTRIGLALYLSADRTASLRRAAEQERAVRVDRPARRSFLGRWLRTPRAVVPAAPRPTPVGDCA